MCDPGRTQVEVRTEGPLGRLLFGLGLGLGLRLGLQQQLLRLQFLLSVSFGR